MGNEELLRLLADPNHTKEELEAAIRETMEPKKAPYALKITPEEAAKAVENIPAEILEAYAKKPVPRVVEDLEGLRTAVEQIPEPIMELGKKTHIDGVTKRGFNFSMSVDAMNDMELLEDLGRLEDDPTLLPGIIRKILGEDQKKALYNFLRDPKTGRGPIEAVSETVAEIFAAAGTAGKN